MSDTWNLLLSQLPEMRALIYGMLDPADRVAYGRTCRLLHADTQEWPPAGRILQKAFTLLAQAVKPQVTEATWAQLRDMCALMYPRLSLLEQAPLCYAKFVHMTLFPTERRAPFPDVQFVWSLYTNGALGETLVDRLYLCLTSVDHKQPAVTVGRLTEFNRWRPPTLRLTCDGHVATGYCCDHKGNALECVTERILHGDPSPRKRGAKQIDCSCPCGNGPVVRFVPWPKDHEARPGVIVQDSSVLVSSM